MVLPKQLKHLQFCRIKKKSKAPFEKDWVNKTYSYNEIQKHFPEENYGVVCGHGDLAVIDCDEEALDVLIDNLLPETYTVKTGSGGKHYYYYVPDLKNKIILKARDDHLGEIQSYGSQVVGAGSIHPNGNEYELVKNVGIKKITYEELEKVLGKFMLNDRKWKVSEDIEDFDEFILEMSKKWKEGNRQQLALNVAGFLRKEKRLGINKAKKVIGKICKLCDDEEIKMRMGAVEETYKKDEKDVKGIQGLREFEVEEKKLTGKIEKFFGKRNLAEQFLDINPLYYDRNKIWWMWDKEEYRWKIIDETDILNSINDIAKVNTITAKEKNQILESLRQEARKRKPEDPEESWIQFKSKIYDLKTGKEFIATPKYFISNPINWKLGESEETPEMDKLFKDWVGEKHVEELYETIAFSCVPSYFIHRMFCLIGSGANGKSTYLKILEKFIGEDNIASSSLYMLLKQRFEGAKLLKKLVCLIGETNFNIINNTDFLKKLSGQDTIRCEFKGKDSFDFKNYAKLIMATNSLPPTGDKTEGFYRRWKIIDFPNKFKKEKDVLSKIPEYEYENLAKKSLRLAKKLWKERMFTNDGDFDERRERYEERANPLMKYINHNYEKDVNSQVIFAEFMDEFNGFLADQGYRTLTKPSLSKQLKNEGFDVRLKTIDGTNTTWILGIKSNQEVSKDSAGNKKIM